MVQVLERRKGGGLKSALQRLCQQCVPDTDNIIRGGARCIKMAPDARKIHFRPARS